MPDCPKCGTRTRRVSTGKWGYVELCPKCGHEPWREHAERFRRFAERERAEQEAARERVKREAHLKP